MAPTRKRPPVTLPEESAEVLSAATSSTARLAVFVVSQVVFPIIACSVMIWVVFWGPNSTAQFNVNVKEMLKEQSQALREAATQISAAVREGTTATGTVIQASAVAQSAVVQAASVTHTEAVKSGFASLDQAIIERTNASVTKLQADMTLLKEGIQRIREAVTAIQLEMERVRK